MTKPNLTIKPSRFRFARAALAEAVATLQADAGMYGAGLIQNVSVLTEGEAIGHGLWIDSTMIQQTHDAIVAAGEKGVKSRFTHPGMCSDGLGKHLGRIANSRIEGKSLIADLHFTKSAHSTPDGDLAEYVTLLVTEDPNAAGLSIVFDRDYRAESLLLMENGAKIVDGEYGQYVDTSDFKSPDASNVENYPHARLLELRAIDVVDEPAANPNGMFDSAPLARNADKALAIALGLETFSGEAEESVAGIDTGRLTEFLSRFFSNRGLSIVKKDGTAVVAGDNEQPPIETSAESATVVTRESLTSELTRYTSRFGSERGVEWFTGGKTFEQALELHCEALQGDNGKLAEQVHSLTERLQSITIGTDPLPVAALTTGEKRTLANLMNPQAK